MHMANSVFMNPKGYLEITYEGDQTEAMVTEVTNDVKALAEKVRKEGNRPLVMIDISKAGNFSMEARQNIFQNLQDEPQEKIAIFGATSEFLKYGVKLFIQGVNRPKDTYQYFDTRQQAEAWLFS